MPDNRHILLTLKRHDMTPTQPKVFQSRYAFYLPSNPLMLATVGSIAEPVTLVERDIGGQRLRDREELGLVSANPTTVSPEERPRLGEYAAPMGGQKQAAFEMGFINPYNTPFVCYSDSDCGARRKCDRGECR